MVKQFLVATLFDFPFRECRNRQSSEHRQQTIPPIVYQTWETKKLGRRHLRSIERFRDANSDLSFVLLDKFERDAYMSKNWSHSVIYEIYNRALFGALQADIFRYCMIYDRGGYYFDISKGTKVAITSLHDSSAEGLISFENNLSEIGKGPENLLKPSNLVIQWGFGFAPGHLILARHIERLEQTFTNFLGRKFLSPKSAILEFSGPVAFTSTVHEFALQNSMSAVTQLDIDFSSQGLYSLNGAGSRFIRYPSYASVRDSAIFL